MTHDPLCLADPTTDNSRCHYCVLIAKVREDMLGQCIESLSGLQSKDKKITRGIRVAEDWLRQRRPACSTGAAMNHDADCRANCPCCAGDWDCTCGASTEDALCDLQEKP